MPPQLQQCDTTVRHYMGDYSIRPQQKFSVEPVECATTNSGIAEEGCNEKFVYSPFKLIIPTGDLAGTYILDSEDDYEYDDGLYQGFPPGNLSISVFRGDVSASASLTMITTATYCLGTVGLNGIEAFYRLAIKATYSTNFAQRSCLYGKTKLSILGSNVLLSLVNDQCTSYQEDQDDPIQGYLTSWCDKFPIQFIQSTRESPEGGYGGPCVISNRRPTIIDSVPQDFYPSYVELEVGDPR